MELTTKRVNLTTLLENDELARIERLRLNPKRRLTNRSQGEHLTGKGGSSTEFSDYRDYVPGDDVRYVDWNIFSRLHRPYLKLFQFEEEMHIVILVDASSSMLFDDKLQLAKQLAAAFAVMGLMSMEKVSVFSCNQTGQRPAIFPPCTGRARMKLLFEFLEGLEGGGDFPIDEAVETVLRLHRGRGIAVLLSDFLTLGNLQRPLNMLFSSGLEVLGVQILGPSEIDPEVTGDLRFVDAETSGTLDITSASDLLGIYQEQRLALESYLADACRKRNGRFVSVSSRDPLKWILFDLLRRQGWVQ